jgi:hypothetical protein
VKRENVKLLIGIAGGTGSGKTYSALRVARGLSGGQPFAFIDTENGRAKHYADLFPEMRHAEIHAPFRPMKYTQAIEAADKDFGVIVVDSASHEWAGDGGCLDWHDEIMGTNQAKNMMAWIEPKREHKRMMTKLLQVDAHVVMCFRAEPKVEVVTENGQQKIIAKRSLVGLDGWIPISEKMQPFEMTASFLMMADRPGVPLPIKLEEQHRPLVPLDAPMTEEVGQALAAWAVGSPTLEAVDNGMTLQDFMALVGNIDKEIIKEAGAELFPGRSSRDLSSEELEQLLGVLREQV